ncbi:MAG: hypothetical protein V7724_05270 [Sediminicola sp.]|tara:strand:- start:21472 stop:21795 length:324 start_codon:yes stop_codon:yes gene_type:complete
MENYLEFFAVFLSGFALGFITLILCGELRESAMDRKANRGDSTENDIQDPGFMTDINDVLNTDLTTRQSYLESKLGLSQIASPVRTNNSLASLKEKILQLKNRNFWD